MNNTNDFAWIIVRAFGVLFLTFTVMEMFVLLSKYLTVVTMENYLANTELTKENRTIVQRNIFSTQSYMMVVGFKAFVYGAVSLYCLKSGTFIFNLLTKRLPSKKEDQSDSAV